MINKIFQLYNKNEDGVAAIEAALILPVAILMFVGIFEVGQMLLLNQKVYAASHMVGDLLTRKTILDNDDLKEAYAAGQMIIDPFQRSGLKLNIAGVKFDKDQNAVEIWQKSFNTINDTSLYSRADNLGSENEGAIIVKASYTYTPVFLNFKMPFIGGGSSAFSILNMDETTVLRGRINSCMTYNDSGTLHTC